MDNRASFEAAFISQRASISITDFLADEVSLSKSSIKRCINAGGVWLKRGDEPMRVRKSSLPIKLDDEIHIYYDPALLAIDTPALQPLQQINDLSFWLKPALNSSASLYSDHLSLARAIDVSLPKGVACHHAFPEIDFCQGVILLAHSNRAAAQLDQAIQHDKFSTALLLDTLALKDAQKMDLHGIMHHDDITLISDQDNQLSINVLSTSAVLKIENWLNQVNQDEDIFIQGMITGVQCLDMNYSLNSEN